MSQLTHNRLFWRQVFPAKHLAMVLTNQTYITQDKHKKPKQPNLTKPTKLKAQFPLPELTARVNGRPVPITRQHGACWRARVSTSGVGGPCLCKKTEFSILLWKHTKIKEKIRVSTSYHMLFTCKVINSCLLLILRNCIDKKSSNIHLVSKNIMYKSMRCAEV